MVAGIARLRGGHLQQFAVPFAALGVLLILAVAAVWARGGFGTEAPPYLGTRVEPGEVIETRWWDVAIHEGWSDPAAGEIHIRLTATNKQTASDFDLTAGMLVLRLPSGKPMLRSSCASQRGSRFGPLVPAEALCTFGYDDNELAAGDLPTGDEFAVELIVLDQKYHNDLVSNPRPVAGEPAGWLPLDIVPRPEEEA